MSKTESAQKSYKICTENGTIATKRATSIETYQPSFEEKLVTSSLRRKRSCNGDEAVETTPYKKVIRKRKRDKRQALSSGYKPATSQDTEQTLETVSQVEKQVQESPRKILKAVRAKDKVVVSRGKRRGSHGIFSEEEKPHKKIIQSDEKNQHQALSSDYKPATSQDTEQTLETLSQVEKQVQESPRKILKAVRAKDKVVLSSPKKRGSHEIFPEEEQPHKKIIQSDEKNQCRALPSDYKADVPEERKHNKNKTKTQKSKKARKPRKIFQAVQASIKKDAFDLKYEVGEVLGQGAFGTVRAATRRKDGTQVAIKFIPNERTTRTVQVGKRRVIPAEAYFLNKAKHPNIIKLLKFYSFNDSHAIVMEKPRDSKNLLQYVEGSNKQLSEAEAKRILRQLVEAVTYLEERDIMHNDLKAENILVDGDGNVKIIDFGLSWILTDEPIKGFTGTYALCPPEYSENHEYFGREANVWSLGCILYDMFTGNVPYKGPDDAMWRSLDLPEYIPEGARSLIISMLQKQPIYRASLQDILSHPWMDE